jgi:hypothetical protein
MTTTKLAPSDLRHTVDAASLGFTDTSELLHLQLPWIGRNAPSGRPALA